MQPPGTAKGGERRGAGWQRGAGDRARRAGIGNEELSTLNEELKISNVEFSQVNGI